MASRAVPVLTWAWVTQAAVTLTPGEEPPVSPAPLAVMVVGAAAIRAPAKVMVQGPPSMPGTTTLPAPILVSATRAAWTAEAVAFQGRAVVVCPL